MNSKNVTLSVLALGLWLSRLAAADFNTDSIHGNVYCYDDDGDEVILKADRKSFIYHMSGDEGGPRTYRNLVRQSDGDTSVSYSSGSGEDSITLVFSDRTGDRLVFGDEDKANNEAPLNLTCSDKK